MPDTRIGHTFGHEFIGLVDQVGWSVENLAGGDRAMVPFNVFCGTCYFRGRYSNCHNLNPNGTGCRRDLRLLTPCGGYYGRQSKYVRVPFADAGPRSR